MSRSSSSTASTPSSRTRSHSSSLRSVGGCFLYSCWCSFYFPVILVCLLNASLILPFFLFIHNKNNIVNIMDFSPWGIIFTYKFLFYNLVRIFLSHCFMGPTGIKLSFLFKFYHNVNFT